MNLAVKRQNTAEFDGTQMAAMSKVIDDAIAGIAAAEDIAAVNEILDKAKEAFAAGFGECPSAKYTDVPAVDNWAHEGIDYCVAENLMNGVSDTLFAPQNAISRAQLVTILYRAAGEPEVAFETTFTDVADGKFYSKAIAWAAKNDVVNGFADGTFKPNAKITREQIATILYRYAGSPAVTGELEFADASSVSNYAKNAMIWATSEGLINGILSEGVEMLSPKSNATRAQVATIIMRFLED